jgi:uncharacterized membrane protein
VVNRPVGKIVTRQYGQLDVMSYTLPALSGTADGATFESRVTALETAEIAAGVGLVGGGAVGSAPLEFSLDLHFLDARYSRSGDAPTASQFAYTWMLA